MGISIDNWISALLGFIAQCVAFELFGFVFLILFGNVKIYFETHKTLKGDQNGRAV